MKTEPLFDLFENIQVGFLIDSTKVVAGDIRLDSSQMLKNQNFSLEYIVIKYLASHTYHRLKCQKLNLQ